MSLIRTTFLCLFVGITVCLFPLGFHKYRVTITYSVRLHINAQLHLWCPYFLTLQPPSASDSVPAALAPTHKCCFCFISHLIFYIPKHSQIAVNVAMDINKRGVRYSVGMQSAAVRRNGLMGSRDKSDVHNVTFRSRRSTRSQFLELQRIELGLLWDFSVVAGLQVNTPLPLCPMGSYFFESFVWRWVERDEWLCHELHIWCLSV